MKLKKSNANDSGVAASAENADAHTRTRKSTTRKPKHKKLQY